MQLRLCPGEDMQGNIPMRPQSILSFLLALICAAAAAFADPGTDLLSAAREGSEEGVRGALAAGADADARDEEGATALMTAAYAGNIPVMKTLIAARAAVNLGDGKGRTALMRAADGGSVEAVKTLTAAGAFVNTGDGDGETALMRAVEGGFDEVTDLLIRVGARWRAAGSSICRGSTPGRSPPAWTLPMAWWRSRRWRKAVQHD